MTNAKMHLRATVHPLFGVPASGIRSRDQILSEGAPGIREGPPGSTLRRSGRRSFFIAKRTRHPERKSKRRAVSERQLGRGHVGHASYG
jgi:hypothetical protein